MRLRADARLVCSIRLRYNLFRALLTSSGATGLFRSAPSMLSEIPIVHTPDTEFSIDGCEEVIIWTTATKQEVLRVIRSDENLTIYIDDDEGPKWLRRQMVYESAMIDVADAEDIKNLKSARGSSDFITGVPSNVRSILIILSHLRRA